MGWGLPPCNFCNATNVLVILFEAHVREEVNSGILVIYKYILHASSTDWVLYITYMDNFTDVGIILDWGNTTRQV